VQSVDTLNFPDAMVTQQNPSNKFTNVKCVDQVKTDVVVNTCPGAPDCRLIAMSLLQAVRDPNKFQNAITCQFFFQDNTQQNDILNIVFPGSWASAPSLFVRPNQLAEVVLEKNIFHPYKSPMSGSHDIISWRPDLSYHTTEFHVSNNATIRFRIGAFDIFYHEEVEYFNSWMMLAAWGGVMYLHYVMFNAVYGIIKQFLPHDSKVFDGDNASGPASYEQIR